MITSTRRQGAIILGLIVAGLAASAGFANSSAPAAANAVRCGVTKTTQQGMVALEGTLLSPTALSGEYRFAIRSTANGGSSNISQGGYFTANANEATVLGKVMLNSSATFDISFKVTADGKTYDCDQDLTTKL